MLIFEGLGIEFFGVLRVHLVFLLLFWYILWRSGLFTVNLVHFSPILVFYPAMKIWQSWLLLGFPERLKFVKPKVGRVSSTLSGHPSFLKAESVDCNVSFGARNKIGAKDPIFRLQIQGCQMLRLKKKFAFGIFCADYC
jgi:hypothetical protein